MRRANQCLTKSPYDPADALTKARAAVLVAVKNF